MLHTLLLASSHNGNSDAGALALAIPIVAILCTFAWLIVRAIMAPFADRRDSGSQGGGKRYRRWRNGPGGGVFPDDDNAPAGGLTEEEQAILRKLQTTITQMERRIESLETILIDQTRTSEKYGTKL